MNNTSQIVAQFCRFHPLSLRTLQRVVAYARIAEICSPAPVLVPFIVCLSIMKVLSPDLYDMARNGTLIQSTVFDNLFRFVDWRDEYDPAKRTLISERVEELWHYALGSLKDKQKIQQIETSFAEHAFSTPKNIIAYCCDLLDGFSLPG